MENDQIDTMNPFNKSSLIAWCIVPYDSVERDAYQRASMLNEMGFTKLAWDWRGKHIPLLETEIKALNQQNIKLEAVWLWLDNRGWTPELSQLLEQVRKTQTKTTFWVSFDNNYFEQKSEKEKIESASTLLSSVSDSVNATGGSLLLYNHGDWFGEPENQIKILNKIGKSNTGLVFNFHHAHHQLNRFPEMLQQLLPYLKVVNLSGLNPYGPKILDIGKGTHEKGMIELLIKHKYSGKIGIIGHTENEDVKEVLKRNLSGLKQILKELKNPAYKSYK
jgi:hypothetical protein